MSHPERPWTEEEKYTLLTEVLKKANVPSVYLYNMIRDLNIIPKWQDIPLPQGRSLNACQLAFENMRRQTMVSSQVTPPSPRTEPWVPPAPPIGSSVSRKRPLYQAERASLMPRAIQPRPLVPMSLSSESASSMQVSSILEPRTIKGGEPPRKRGRPSKAEAERRKAVAEARGEPYPPPRRSTEAKSKHSPTPRAMPHTSEMRERGILHSEAGGGGEGYPSGESVIGEPDPVKAIIHRHGDVQPPTREHESQTMQQEFHSQPPLPPFVSAPHIPLESPMIEEPRYSTHSGTYPTQNQPSPTPEKASEAGKAVIHSSPGCKEAKS